MTKLGWIGLNRKFKALKHVLRPSSCFLPFRYPIRSYLGVGDVADLVAVVDITRAVGQERHEALEGGGTALPLEVEAGEAALELGASVMHLQELLKRHVAPVGHLDLAGGMGWVFMGPLVNIWVVVGW